MDAFSATFTLMGIAMLAASWIYLMVIAFKDDYAWGITSVFVPPLAYLYAAFNPSRAAPVLILAAIGLALLILG